MAGYWLSFLLLFFYYSFSFKPSPAVRAKMSLSRAKIKPHRTPANINSIIGHGHAFVSTRLLAVGVFYPYSFSGFILLAEKLRRTVSLFRFLE